MFKALWFYLLGAIRINVSHAFMNIKTTKNYITFN